MSILPNATYISPGNPFYGTGSQTGGAVSATSVAISPTAPNTSGVLSISNNGGNTVSFTVDGATNNLVISQVVPPAGPQNIMSVSNSTGNVTFTNGVFAPNIQYAQTAYTQLVGAWGAAPYPTDVTGGKVAGQTYTAPRTGVYVVFYDFGFNIDIAKPVVVGASDLVFGGLTDPSGSLILASSTTIHPVNMNASDGTPAGIDYGMTSSDIISLTAGEVVQLTRYVYNASGTMALAANNSAVGATIIPLC